MTTKKPCYKRIMLKFSGEALLGRSSHGIDIDVVKYIAAEIKPLISRSVEIGIIIGGGNFFRGAKLEHNEISRVTGDHLGMIATILNSLAMRDIFEYSGIQTKIMSALPIDGVIPRYDCHKAKRHLAKGNVIIFAGGIGNPFVTTDTALGMRGIELDADLLLKATNVDGVYSADPQIDSNAKFYGHLTYDEVLAKELAVMDLAAFCLCRDHKMKLRVYNMHKKGALLRIIDGQDEGTIIGG